MPKGKIGLEQLNENLKQKIELGGSGGGGGVGFLKNTVVVTTSTNTVKIGLQFKPGTDALLVFKNSTYQELEHDYTIDETGKYIQTTSGQWIASNEAPVTFNFIVLRTVPLANSIASNTGAVGFIRKTILVEQDTNEIELDLMYNKVTDAILVFRNSVLIEEEEDYTIDMDRQVLINPNANWVAGTLLNLMVFKSVPAENVKFDGEIIKDGTISIDKLSPEFNVLINNLVKDFETSMVQINQDIKNLENTMNNTINNNMANMQNQINDIETLLASKQNKTDNSLQTSSKNIVGAINEVFQYANNGKSNIAAVVGSPTTSSNTFQEMKTNIQKCKNTLASNLTTKGVKSAGSESLLSLCDKVKNISSGIPVTNPIPGESNIPWGTISYVGSINAPGLKDCVGGIYGDLIKNSKLTKYNNSAFFITSSNKVQALDLSTLAFSDIASSVPYDSGCVGSHYFNDTLYIYTGRAYLSSNGNGFTMHKASDVNVYSSSSLNVNANYVVPSVSTYGPPTHIFYGNNDKTVYYMSEDGTIKGSHTIYNYDKFRYYWGKDGILGMRAQTTERYSSSKTYITAKIASGRISFMETDPENGPTFSPYGIDTKGFVHMRGVHSDQYHVDRNYIYKINGLADGNVDKTLLLNEERYQRYGSLSILTKAHSCNFIISQIIQGAKAELLCFNEDTTSNIITRISIPFTPTWTSANHIFYYSNNRLHIYKYTRCL